MSMSLLMTKTGLSIIIPSREDSYLKQTVSDLLAKAGGEIEVIVVLDGYWPRDYHWEDPRVVVIRQARRGMRAAINAGIAISRGEYIMKLDEHCMVDEGFDLKLKAGCDNDSVIIPRRYRLNPDVWKIIEDGRPPIDYMYIENKGGYLHGTIDKERTEERKDWSIDYTMTFQGSCWFMKKEFWNKVIGPMDDVNYGAFSNEAQEIGNKAWLSGGTVKVNKLTWYAHWHRDRRGYGFTNEEQRQFNESVAKGRAYSADFWLNNKWDKRVRDYEWLLKHFGREDQS